MFVAGRNALLVACFNGNIDAAEILLQGGASLQTDCDTNPLRGGKAIHYAAWGGHFHVLKWIIERSAGNLHETDLVGNTPMLYAVYGGHLELIRVLLRMGCSLLERNSKGELPTSVLFKRHTYVSGVNFNLRRKNSAGKMQSYVLSFCDQS